MKQIPRCDWLAERARWSYTARSEFLAWSRKIKDLFFFWCFIPYNKSFIDQACSVKIAGYWTSSGAIIGDGDRKRAPFLVLGLAP